MLLVLPVTVISSVLLLRTGQNAKIKGDAAIAMISVAALAFGYLLIRRVISPERSVTAYRLLSSNVIERTLFIPGCARASVRS